MSVFGFYIPFYGIEVDFDEATINMPRKLSANWGDKIVINRNTRTRKTTQLKRKHLADASISPRIPKFCDWEIYIPGDNFDYFDGDIIHGIAFCLLIRKNCCLHFPIWSTCSTIFDGDYDDVYCGEVLSGEPLFYLESDKVSLTDIEWISTNLPTVLKMMEHTRFQNAMQALNAYQYIPHSNFNFLVSWTGIEALFGISQEISFRVSLLLSKYLADERSQENRFKEFKKAYDLRSKVAHGYSTKAKVSADQSIFARKTLARCLQRVIEDRSTPNEENILFG